MIKRAAIVVGVFLLVVLAGLMVVLRKPAEPMFEGKPLSEWLEGHTASSGANPPYGSPGWLKADEALRKIGSNGVPVLIEMIGASEDSLKARATKLLAKQRFVQVRHRYARAMNDEAVYAFEVLGESGAGAVPALIELYEEPTSAYSQMCVANALGSIGRPAEAALPALIRNFKSTNAEVRFYAVSAVGSIGGDPEVVIPALRSALEDAKMETVWNAVVGLSGFGRNARPCVADLFAVHKRAAESGNKALVEQAEIALWRIAPDKSPRALMVEKGTPIVRDGVVTAPVYFELNGDRRVWVKAGSKDPSYGQCWESEPRGLIKVYRGAADGSEREEFLGAFEVEGLAPKPASLNVGVICGIAGGDIFIGARDYSADTFVEIRRVEAGSDEGL